MHRWTDRLSGALHRPVLVREFLDARADGKLDVEDAFFTHLRLASGVFKTTRRGRFDDTFPLLFSALAPSTTKLRCLDVACSSGVATVELHRALLARGIVAETVGTDLVIRATHAELPDGTALLVDSDGNVLRVELGGASIANPPTRREMFFSPLRVARSRWIVFRWAATSRGAPPAGARLTEVPLVSSTVDREPGVQVVAEDILAPTVPGRFGLVRAANILNLAYFDPKTLRALAAALLRRLEEGGLLFVTRTDDGGGNHGTLWSRGPTGLREVGRVGRGSEAAFFVEDESRIIASPASQAGR
jgi:hypothetical protein